MYSIVVFGATQSGKTTLLGYLATGMLRTPQFNIEVLNKFKLIKKLTTKDEFSIGDPYNPVHVNKDIILPSFISLDRDELIKFRDQSTPGTTKRIHHQEINICISEKIENSLDQENENENIAFTFVDLPGFRQKLSDKYRGFFEGNIGIAVLKLQDVVELSNLCHSNDENDKERIVTQEKKLFEPIRIWCDYRSPKSLMIVLSQIDRSLKGKTDEEKVRNQIEDINKAILFIREYSAQFSQNISIPISPISIKITSEKNTKQHYRMSVFFHREEENIYQKPKNKNLPGDGTLISCLKKIMPTNNKQKNVFGMASVYKPMKAIVNGSTKTALNVNAVHGNINLSDDLFLGPVKDKNNEIVFVKCEISSIKADGAKNTSIKLLEGNAGGLVFKSVRDIINAKKRYNLSFNKKESELKILKSSILYNSSIIKGDIIELIIEKKYHYIDDNLLDKIYDVILPSLMPFDQLVIFWYGKKIITNVVEINKLEDKYKLSVIISKEEKNVAPIVVLPCNEYKALKFKKDNVLIAVPRIYYTSRHKKEVQGMYTYLSSNIVGIKNSEDIKKIIINSNETIDMDEVFNGIHFEKQPECMSPYMIHIDTKKDNKHLDLYYFIKKIGRNTRKLVNRKVYRQIGGLFVSLASDD